MHLYDHQLSYFSVPKCANTSIKTMLFELENGFKFKPYKVNGQTISIHQIVHNEAFDGQPHDRIEGHKKFTVLRSPEERLLSFYGDKFLSGELKRRKIDVQFAERGLPAEPTLDEFVENVEAYRDVNEFMRSHLCPLSYYLSTDPDYFDRIFRVADLDQLPDYLTQFVSTPVELEHMRKRSHRYEGLTLSDANIAHIRDVYAEDYEIFGQYF